MRRFYLAARFVSGAEIALPADLQRHLRTVLRLPTGTEICLFDGAGGEARAILGDGESARILAVEQQARPPLALCLIQGIPKGEKLELVLQKGTELGVNSFWLAEMERSVSRLKSDRREAKLQRWRKIVQEAARQCGQPQLPQVECGGSLADVLPQVQADLKLLLWEEADVPLAEHMPATRPEKIAVIIGPEGGISPAEVVTARREGFRPVRLGPRILRTETAGLAIMSILQYLYGDFSTVQTGRVSALQGKDES